MDSAIVFSVEAHAIENELRQDQQEFWQENFSLMINDVEAYQNKEDQMTKILEINKNQLKKRDANQSAGLVLFFLLIGLVVSVIFFKYNSKISKLPEVQSQGILIMKNNLSLYLKEIIYIAKKNNEDKCIFYMADGSTHEEYMSLNKLEASKKLPFPLFIRTHQSFIVNILKIKAVLAGKKQIELDYPNPEKRLVDVSRHKKKKVFTVLDRFKI